VNGRVFASTGSDRPRESGEAIGLARLGRWSLLLATLIGCSEPNAYQPPPPPTVSVALPVRATVVDYLEEVGTTEAVERAEIRARVRGVLVEQLFEPGKEVTAGSPLFRIERAEYEAARDAARAAVDGAEANRAAAVASIAVADAGLQEVAAAVEQTEAEFARQERLLADRSTSPSERDRAKAARDSALAQRQSFEARRRAAEADQLKAEAAMSQAAAELQRAELDLTYTEVTATIGGKITVSDIKLGNLVEPGDRLATIVRPTPIWTRFRVDERTVLALEAMRRRNGEQRDLRDIPVGLQRAGDREFPIAGHLDYVDQEGIDRSTGTLEVRALFPNEEGLLMPGLFVRLRVPIGRFENALLVPATAVGRDPIGTYLLVAIDGKVQRRSVETGPKVGPLIVIRSGVEANDQVIVDGLQRARPGAEVTTELKTLPAPQGDESTDVEANGSPGASDSVAPPAGASAPVSSANESNA